MYAAADIAEVRGDDAIEALASQRTQLLAVLAPLADYVAVRQATLALLAGLPDEAWLYRGEVNDYEATVRGLAFHIAGHELRHLRAIETKYWPHVRGQHALHGY